MSQINIPLPIGSFPIGTVLQKDCRGYVNFSEASPGAFSGGFRVFCRPWAYLNGDDRETETYHFISETPWTVGQNIQFDIVQGKYSPDISNPVAVDHF